MTSTIFALVIVIPLVILMHILFYANQRKRKRKDYLNQYCVCGHRRRAHVKRTITSVRLGVESEVIGNYCLGEHKIGQRCSCYFFYPEKEDGPPSRQVRA